MAKDISVVIVSYKNPEKLERCLQTLLQNQGEELFEVIVIDNCSNDLTRDLEAHFPEVRFFWNHENVGYAPACNQGAEKAQGRYLLFLNPDTEILAGSLAKLKSSLQLNPELGAVGPLSNYAGGWQNMGYHLPDQGEGFKNAEEVSLWLNQNRYGEKKEVKLLIGFCLLMSREFFSEINGMDPELILGMDDLDLSWRIRNCGKKLSVVLDSFVYHVGQQSFEKLEGERRNWT